MRTLGISERRNNQQRPTCHGYVCLYSCVAEFNDDILGVGASLETLNLPYRYEVYSNIATEDLASELLKVESLMLSSISSETRLDSCELSPVYGQVAFDSDLHDWLFPDATLSNELIVSLASSPVDVADTVNRKYFLCT